MLSTGGWTEGTFLQLDFLSWHCLKQNLYLHSLSVVYSFSKRLQMFVQSCSPCYSKFACFFALLHCKNHMSGRYDIKFVQNSWNGKSLEELSEKCRNVYKKLRSDYYSFLLVFAACIFWPAFAPHHQLNWPEENCGNGKQIFIDLTSAQDTVSVLWYSVSGPDSWHYNFGENTV